MDRIDNTLYNILDSNTSENVTYTKVTTWYDGTAMTDEKCDGVIYRKKGSEYFKRNFTGAADIRWFGAKCNGVVDDTLAIQKAVDAYFKIFIPEGEIKITAPIEILGRRYISGVQQTRTLLYAYGCDAFVINGANGDNLTISDMQIRSFSAVGAADPKTDTGIKSFGLVDAAVNYLTIRDVTIIGFNYCIDWQYTWNSLIDNVTTLNCEYGVRLYGISVNNSICNSRLQANTGTSSIATKYDTVTSVNGEGLTISNTLMAGGEFGITSDGFLLLSISNCTIDLIQDIGLSLTDVKCLNIANTWIYATNRGIVFNPLSVPVVQGSSVTNCRIQTTGDTSYSVVIWGNNKGIAFCGGHMIVPESGGRNIQISEAESVSITGVFLQNPTAFESIAVIDSTDVKYGQLIGNDTVIETP